MEVPSPFLQVNFTPDLSYTLNQTGSNHMASIIWQSALNIAFDIHWEDLNSSLITSSFLINTLTQIHASTTLCEYILYLLYDRWWLGSTWLLSIYPSVKTFYNLQTNLYLLKPWTFKVLISFYRAKLKTASQQYFPLQYFPSKPVLGCSIR